ncbi:unnamed protein product [Brassica oleracea]
MGKKDGVYYHLVGGVIFFPLQIKQALFSFHLKDKFFLPTDFSSQKGYQGIGRVRFPICSIQEESLIPRNISRKEASQPRFGTPPMSICSKSLFSKVVFRGRFYFHLERFACVFLGYSLPVSCKRPQSTQGSLQDGVQLAETFGIAGVRSPQVSVLWGTVKHIRQGVPRGISFLHSSGRSNASSDVQQVVSRSGTHARKLSLYTPPGRKAAGEGGRHWAGSISSEFPVKIEASIKKIL